MILKIKNTAGTKSLKIDFFNRFRLTLSYAAVASFFVFDWYFDPDNPDHKELGHIGHYHDVTVEEEGELLLTGRILSQSYGALDIKKLAEISGYSLSGFIEDCQIPTSAYPLQMDGLTINQIASQLLAPFKLKKIVDPSVAGLMNEPIEITTAGPTDTVKGYLMSLCAQKNIIISHNEKGNVVFTRANTNKKTILNFDGESIPGVEMSMVFSGQQMHSDITVQKQADIDGGDAGEFTIKNPFVPFVFRPRVIQQTSGNDNDTESAARNALASEIKNIKFAISLNRWLDENNNLIKPDELVSVRNKEIFLYDKTILFIESVTYIEDKDKKVAELICVLPEVYNGKTPIYIFDE